MLMASQTLIESHKVTVITSQTQFEGPMAIIWINQEMLMASQTLIGSHKITVMTSQIQLRTYKTVIRRNQEMLMTFQTDQEPQGNSHSIPDSVGVSQSSN